MDEHVDKTMEIANRMDEAASLPDFQTFDDWLAFGRKLGNASSKLSWLFGDWWIAGHAYGERTAIVRADDWTGPSFQRCMDCGTVARRFETSSRDEVLSFKHHRLVASLPDEIALPLLTHAREQGLSAAKLEELAKEHRDTDNTGHFPRCVRQGNLGRWCIRPCTTWVWLPLSFRKVPGAGQV